MKTKSRPCAGARVRLAAISLVCASTILCAGAMLFAIAANAQTPIPTTTTFTITSGGSAVTTVKAGTVVTLSATVKAGSAAVTAGTVNFCVATAASCTDVHLVGTAQLTAEGTASIKFRPGPGAHSYNAVFAGTGTDGFSTSSTASLTVTAPSSYPTVSTLAESGSPGNYTLTASVYGSGPAAPSGTVSFNQVGAASPLLGQATLSAHATTSSLANISNLAENTRSQVQAPLIADFNRDGIPDLAFTDPATGSFNVYLGNGDGTFTAKLNQAPGTNGVAIGDFNGDGIPDFVSLGTTSLGNGDGTFTAIQNGVLPGIGPGPVVVADFNGDGNLDLAFLDSNGETWTNNKPESLTVWLGDGHGKFTRAPQDLNRVFLSGPMAVGDFNGDGIPDLAMLSTVNTPYGKEYDIAQVTLYLGNGDGTFTQGQTIAINGSANSLILADFNGDGNLDLAVLYASIKTNQAPSSGVLQVILGDGEGGTLSGGESITGLGVFPMSLAVGDFNGDGIADVAVTFQGLPFEGKVDLGYLQLAVGNGDGTFSTAPDALQLGKNLDFMGMADFNGDGLEDVAVSETSSDYSLAVLLSEGQTASATASGIAVLPVATGTHAVVAAFGGDSAYNASTSNAVTLASAMGTPTVTLASSANPVTYGVPLTLTTTVTGSGLTPTGTISLDDGSAFIGGGALAGGVEAHTTSRLAAGVHSITAGYSGDADYNPATSAAYSLTVIPATPLAKLAASAPSVTKGSAVTLTATFTSVAGAPTGSAIFMDCNTRLGTDALSAAGTASLTTSSLPIGSNSITAQNSGDSNFKAVTSAAVSIRVTGDTKPAFTLTTSASTTTYGGFVDFKATLTGSAGTPTGAVKFYDGATQFDKANLNSSGVASYGTRYLAAGAHSITASYGGDSHYAAATSAAVSVTVSKATPSIKLKASTTSAMINTPVTFSATVTGAFSRAPVGIVVYYDGTTELGYGTLNASGVATYTTSALKAGTHSITAEYTGHTNYTAKTSAAVSVTITGP